MTEVCQVFFPFIQEKKEHAVKKKYSHFFGQELGILKKSDNAKVLLFALLLLGGQLLKWGPG